jgi:hypothetical protein
VQETGHEHHELGLRPGEIAHLAHGADQAAA